MTRTALDWDLARSRLSAAGRALEESLAENPVRAAAIYRERAIRLARAPSLSPAAQPTLPVLIFRLSGERCAIELKDLAEVLPFGRCTRPPGTPPHFAGVISLRGELWPVLDLARFLGIPEAEPASAPGVLIVRRPGRELGLKVDRVEQIGELRPEDLTPSAGKYAKGISSGAILLLGVDAIVAEIFSGTHANGTDLEEKELLRA